LGGNQASCSRDIHSLVLLGEDLIAFMLQAVVEAGPQNFGGSLQHSRQHQGKERNIMVAPYTYPPKQLFAVSGPRKVMIENSDGKIVGFKNIPEHVRFETVLEEHAIAFAQDVYRRENIILNITATSLEAT
jgi:hypothetical protein